MVRASLRVWIVRAAAFPARVASSLLDGVVIPAKKTRHRGAAGLEVGLVS